MERLEKTSTLQVVKVDGKWKCKKISTTKMFDRDFGKWAKVGEPTIEIVGLDAYKPTPKKIIESEILLIRPAFNSFEELYCYARQKVRIEVQEYAYLEDFFITELPMGYFQQDLLSGVCAPLTLRNPNVKVTREKPIQIDVEEFNKLKSKYRCYHENPKTGELSIEVQAQ